MTRILSISTTNGNNIWNHGSIKALFPNLISYQSIHILGMIPVKTSENEALYMLLVRPSLILET